MRALMARKEDEMEMLTATVATAVSISFSVEALNKWKATHRRAPSAADAQAQNSTIGRLAAMFPGAVKVIN